MNATKTAYTVQRTFNGAWSEAVAASTHRTLGAAQKAAAKLLRGMSQGWGVRIVDANGASVTLDAE